MAHVLEIKGYSSEEIQLLIDEEKDHKIRLKLCAIYQVSFAVMLMSVSIEI